MSSIVIPSRNSEGLDFDSCSFLKVSGDIGERLWTIGSRRNASEKLGADAAGAFVIEDNFERCGASFMTCLICSYFYHHRGRKVQGTQTTSMSILPMNQVQAAPELSSDSQPAPPRRLRG